MQPGDVLNCLRSRLRTQSARPLYTFYDAAQGARIELSRATFANWTAKISNLCLDLGCGPGDVVSLPVFREHPLHWISAVWLLGVWQAGCEVCLTDDERAMITVLADADLRDGQSSFYDSGQLVVCALTPLPSAVSDLPSDAIDFVEVLSQPDASGFHSWAADDQALCGLAEASVDGLTWAEINSTSEPERVLLANADAGQCIAALVGVIRAGSSIVAVESATTAQLATIRTSERLP